MFPTPIIHFIMNRHQNTTTPRRRRYAHIINQLTWMTHAHNLRRVSEDFCIDLYLRPPNIGSFKLMDYHLMERIVKDAYRWGLGLRARVLSLCGVGRGGNQANQ